MSVDTRKVAEAWRTSLPPQTVENPFIPSFTFTAGTDAKDKPTPRAITERLARMRQMAKSAGGNAVNFVIKKDTSGNGSTPSTPSKARNGAGAGKSTASTPGSAKRRKMEAANAASDDNDDEIMKTPSKTPRVKEASPVEAKAIKLELEELGNMQDTPTKRSRKSSVLSAGMVHYFADDEETERENSASEVLPEESGVKKEDVNMSFA